MQTQRERGSKVGRAGQMKYRKGEIAECNKVAQKTLMSGCDKGDAARARCLLRPSLKAASLQSRQRHELTSSK